MLSDRMEPSCACVIITFSLFDSVMASCCYDDRRLYKPSTLIPFIKTNPRVCISLYSWHDRLNWYRLELTKLALVCTVDRSKGREIPNGRSMGFSVNNSVDTLVETLYLQL